MQQERATSVPCQHFLNRSIAYIGARNRLQRARELRENAASKNCQAERWYLRSFSTSVVRRMLSNRAAPATVPSASCSALRISPISTADKRCLRPLPPDG